MTGRTHRARGFTLLEMMAVVLIIALVATLVIPGLGVVDSQTLDRAAHTLANDLEFARQRTVMTGVPHRLLLDLDRGSWHVEWLVTTPAEVTRPVPGVINLSPPPSGSARFESLPSEMGRSQRLPDGFLIEAVETSDQRIDSGDVSVAFSADGTAEATAIVLAHEGGTAVILDVLPLADAVQVRDAI